MADIQALLTALDVFTRAPDKLSLEKANAWLQDFQHSVNTLSPWPPTTTSDSPPSACSHSLRRGRPVTSFYDRQMHPPLQSYLQLKHSGQRSASLSQHLSPLHSFGQVTYDLAQVDPAQLFPLRDIILAALEHFKEGPRAIILQLCLALSGLALQLPTWTNAVEGLIDSYGQNPSMVPALLQFLTVLPEELCSNTKIPVTVQFRRNLPNLSLL